MKPQKKLLVREANNLIEAKYKLDIWEARIFLSALSQIKPSDEDFKKYKIYVNDIITEHNITSNTAYESLKKAAKTLRKKEITIPYEFEGEMLQLTTGLITSYGSKEEIEWEDDGAYVIVDLHPDLKPYLLQLKAQFTQYNISFLMQMQSGHSRRIYRLLKQYTKIGKRKISIEKLREVLCVEKNEYKLYGHFKKRVLEKAQKDLEAYTDITFEFEEIKRGRKVREILFLIKMKDLGLIGDDKDPLNIKTIIPLQYSPLLEWGVTPSTIEKFMISHKESEIMQRINYLEKLEQSEAGQKIKNWAAYFHKLMEEDDFVDSLKAKERKDASKRAEKAITATQRKNIEQSIEKLKKSKTEAIKALVGSIFKEHEGLDSKVVALVKRRKYSGFDKKMSTEENLTKNSMFRGAVQAELAKQFPQQFLAIEEEFSSKIKTLQQQFEVLK